MLYEVFQIKFCKMVILIFFKYILYIAKIPNINTDTPIITVQGKICKCQAGTTNNINNEIFIILKY